MAGDVCNIHALKTTNPLSDRHILVICIKANLLLRESHMKEAAGDTRKYGDSAQES
jgi:hypothetical protein